VWVGSATSADSRAAPRWIDAEGDAIAVMGAHTLMAILRPTPPWAKLVRKPDPDQCDVGPPHSGRYKWSGSSCYWEPKDSGPNQCTS
jgi:hypothetical protein